MELDVWRRLAPLDEGALERWEAWSRRGETPKDLERLAREESPALSRFVSLQRELGPKARASTTVQIKASTPRTKSNRRRVPARNSMIGEKRLAARKASGSTMMAAPIVPKNAMRMVSPIAQATSLCRHIGLFHQSAMAPVIFARSGSIRAPNMISPNPCP